MDVSGPPPLTPPCVRGSITLQFTTSPLVRRSPEYWPQQLKKQPAVFFPPWTWTCGLVWSAAQPATTGWLLLEAELRVCFHYIVGNERWGVPWSTFERGLWDACGGKIALCTQ